LIKLFLEEILDSPFFNDFAIPMRVISYGPDSADGYRTIGVYTGRILEARSRPTCPSRSRRNLNWSSTARPLGLDVPPTLLAIVDEVIN